MNNFSFDNNELYFIKSNINGYRVSLYEIANWKNGLAFRNIDFSPTGKPIIKIAELNNGITSSTSYTNQIFSDDFLLSKGDLVFSWSGNPQTSIDIFKYNLPDGWLNQHIFKITPYENKINKNYLFYIMKYLKPNFTQIATNKQTTGLGHVTISDIKKISFILPPLEVQKKIAGVLGALDDKIELNNKINQNLEAQAQALFKSWFVDFEPFGGQMPDDWVEKTLEQFCRIFTGRKNANEYTPNGKNPFFTCAPEPLRIDSHIYDGPAVIIAGNGAYTGRTRFYNGKFDLYQRTYACTPLPDINQDYIYLLFVAVKMLLQEKIMGGTHGSAVPYIVMNDIAKFNFFFDEEVFNKLSPIMKYYVENILANEQENAKLAELRDTLLPKLMSGEIIIQ